MWSRLTWHAEGLKRWAVFLIIIFFLTPCQPLLGWVRLRFFGSGCSCISFLLFCRYGPIFFLFLTRRPKKKRGKNTMHSQMMHRGFGSSHLPVIFFITAREPWEELPDESHHITVAGEVDSFLRRWVLEGSGGERQTFLKKTKNKIINKYFRLSIFSPFSHSTFPNFLLRVFFKFPCSCLRDRWRDS